MSRVLLRLSWIVFCTVWIHGILFGPSDDEAYYWVLAQSLDWGYAYHPPMVAWFIAFSQWLWGWADGNHSTLVLRFPSALVSGLLVFIAGKWLLSIQPQLSRSRLIGSLLVFIALPGIYALSWMMVPDIPLFLGWILSFYATWCLCSGSHLVRNRFLLGFGIFLSILSKYSGVLVPASAFLCILFWSPQKNRTKTLMVIVLAGILASIPILIWNAQHEWVSILYQIKDRHGGELSFVRYFRFWLIEIVIAGPALVFFSFSFFKRIRWKEFLKKTEPSSSIQVSRFVWIWAAPGILAFFFQPLWADFKPHWALVVWLPWILELAYYFSVSQFKRLARVQLAYGGFLIAMTYMACHFPLQGWVTETFSKKELNPLLDMTNDLHGWNDIRITMERQLGPRFKEMPVVGGRYQTASQIAFAWGSIDRVTLLPRGVREKDEWKDLGLTERPEDRYSRVLKPFIFIADNRYSSGPEFNGDCSSILTLSIQREGLRAKRFQAWECRPR